MRIKSDSVRIWRVPTSIIYLVAGKPTGMPQAARRSRIKAAFGKGLGEAMFSSHRFAPITSVRLITSLVAGCRQIPVCGPVIVSA